MPEAASGLDTGSRGRLARPHWYSPEVAARPQGTHYFAAAGPRAGRRKPECGTGLKPVLQHHVRHRGWTRHLSGKPAKASRIRTKSAVRGACTVTSASRNTPDLPIPSATRLREQPGHARDAQVHRRCIQTRPPRFSRRGVVEPNSVDLALPKRRWY